MALIQNYESFKIEKDETIEDMFSRFRTLIASLKVLNKGYTIADHVNKIIKSFPKKWRPMETTFKVLRDFNITTQKKLISSIRSHVIEIKEENPKKKGKPVDLKSKSKPKKFKGLQAKKEESEEDYEEEDELYLLSRRVNNLVKEK